MFVTRILPSPLLLNRPNVPHLHCQKCYCYNMVSLPYKINKKIEQKQNNNNNEPKTEKDIYFLVIYNYVKKKCE